MSFAGSVCVVFLLESLVSSREAARRRPVEGVEDARSAEDGSGPSMVLYGRRRDSRRIAFQSQSGCGQCYATAADVHCLSALLARPRRTTGKCRSSAESHAQQPRRREQPSALLISDYWHDRQHIGGPAICMLLLLMYSSPLGCYVSRFVSTLVALAWLVHGRCPQSSGQRQERRVQPLREACRHTGLPRLLVGRVRSTLTTGRIISPARAVVYHTTLQLLHVSLYTSHSTHPYMLTHSSLKGVLQDISAAVRTSAPRWQLGEL